jgi:DNA helicase-2/ATP-dependent DNA helicase PcrA
MEIKPLKSLDLFLSEVSLMTDLDEGSKIKKAEEQKDTDKVSLMTIHSAKGLEFPYVYIVGMEENLFPSIMSLNSRNDLEEERRLFYVALTRAERKVFLSHAEGRMRWGQYHFSEASRFINEIDPELLELVIAEEPQELQSIASARKMATAQTPEQKFEKKAPPSISKPTFASRPNIENLKKVTPSMTNRTGTSPSNDIHIDDEILHEKFGIGKVLSIEGEGGNRKAIILFEKYGEKTLLLQFAKLSKVN